MASLKVALKGIGEFECTGKEEFISPEIEKFYAALLPVAPVVHSAEDNSRPAPVVAQDCIVKRIIESDDTCFADVLPLLMTGKLNLNVGDTITIPLKDGTSAEFVLTQEDDEAYRFESVTCVGGDTVTHDKVDDLFERYYDLLPKILTDNLLLTKRRYRDRNDAIQERESVLFLPSAPEVFPEDDVYGDSGLYEQMEYYKDRRHRIRKLTQDSKDTVSWWLMSAHAGTTSSFCNVTSYGNANNNNASSTWIGAPVCFRIRKSK